MGESNKRCAVVYVAGPFRAPTAWGIAENVRAAERVGLEVARAGAMPLIPHANTHLFHGEGDDQVWIDGTLELLRRCDAVVLLPTWESSAGARGEEAEAARLGMPVLDLAMHRATWTLAVQSFVRDLVEACRG